MSEARKIRLAARDVLFGLSDKLCSNACPEICDRTARHRARRLRFAVGNALGELGWSLGSDKRGVPL